LWPVFYGCARSHAPRRLCVSAVRAVLTFWAGSTPKAVGAELRRWVSEGKVMSTSQQNQMDP
jgi:hypothetical protein